MKINNVSINVEYWKEKTFEEFEKALKGKVKGDKIKSAYDSFKVVKPKKTKEVK
jgi:hypothetical protein